jgi:DNA processing protein
MTTDDWVALAMLWWRGRGRTAIARWLSDPAGAPRIRHDPGVSLRTVLAAVDPALTAPDRLARARTAAKEALEAANGAGMCALSWADRRYPSLLAAIPDPPPVLWLRGCVEALETPSVAIVGSRAGSTYAREVGHELGSALAARGVTVVSGLARGVDAAAHQGALAVGGRTVAVLGSSVDIVYPPEHTGLAAEVVARGALVSEFPPGTRPRPAHFPMRNRLISGLSRAVVVVEAAEKSGSLITARLALEQGREVMAVPGNALSGRNRGAHALLKDGAKLVEGVDDILEEIGPAPCEARTSDTEEDPLLQHLARGDSCDLDELMARSGLDGPRLLPRLLALELDGRVVRIAGGRFRRTAESSR